MERRNAGPHGVPPDNKHLRSCGMCQPPHTGNRGARAKRRTAARSGTRYPNPAHIHVHCRAAHGGPMTDADPSTRHLFRARFYPGGGGKCAGRGVHPRTHHHIARLHRIQAAHPRESVRSSALAVHPRE